MSQWADRKRSPRPGPPSNPYEGDTRATHNRSCRSRVDRVCRMNQNNNNEKKGNFEFIFLSGDPGTTGILPCGAQIKDRLLKQPEEDKDNVLLLLGWM